MSIPPLVCSTPPPPDQCEDDKDNEDFDLSYSLSQEDDDDENIDYNYSNFSSYNHFQSVTGIKPLEIKDQEIAQNKVSEIHEDIFIQCENNEESEQSNSSGNVFESNDINENKLKCEEDMNIEDLNLKVDEEIAPNIEDISDKNDTSDQNADSLKDLNIPCNSNSQDEDNTNVSACENVISSTNGSKKAHLDLDEPGDVITENETIVENIDDLTHLKEVYDESPTELHDPSKSEYAMEKLNEFPEEFQQSPQLLEVHISENVGDDDFGDFDDFQFVNTKNNVTSVVDSSNPWENSDKNETDFDSFTANFEENKFNTKDSIPIESEPLSIADQIKNKVNNEECNLEDDEFGEFDDFQSSSAKTDSNAFYEEPCHELPVLNLQLSDNEHHIMESITKVLTSVFIEEISEPVSEFEGKLESLLSETWGHLMETDERQPYIVNWNNSLGQKTLLKALCIDSRNILFGPKWSNHMPKYAANLSNAPLQPQKQSSAPCVPPSEVIADKPSIKSTTWSDPFTSDGQESCNAENDSSTIKPRPTDLDVFEAATSTKPENLYSSTLNVQPIRQINLPDTHIFTPTDSEIPRSKTIHYDRGPTVPLPQPVITDHKNPTDKSATQNANSNVKTTVEDDNEYWEFQDFKSTPEACSFAGQVSQPPMQKEVNYETATTINALPKPSIAYQAQLLQPIKVEPSMPSLNWPDPGEIKSAYDDFSDFVSISPQTSENQDSVKMQSPVLQMDSKEIIPSDSIDPNDKNTEAVEPVTKSFDDEFDTFQSALPPKGPTNEFRTSTLGNIGDITSDSRFTEFDYVPPKSNSIKSDTISFLTKPRSNKALTQNVGYTSNNLELCNKSTLASGTQPTLLQPTPASIAVVNTQNQRTTGQILQPLSLESYSQINWPSPGIDLQDLSRFNPVETLQSLKSDLNVSGHSKVASPVHTQKNSGNQVSDDDVWGDFVSSKPKLQQTLPKKTVFAEDDEWTDFISSPSVKPQNGLNTISLNVHTNSNIQKTVQNKLSTKSNKTPVDIPSLNYITPKSNIHKSYNDKHFQNL